MQSEEEIDSELNKGDIIETKRIDNHQQPSLVSTIEKSEDRNTNQEEIPSLPLNEAGT